MLDASNRPEISLNGLTRSFNQREGSAGRHGKTAQADLVMDSRTFAGQESTLKWLSLELSRQLRLELVHVAGDQHRHHHS
jgi:hypothetical protein